MQELKSSPSWNPEAPGTRSQPVCLAVSAPVWNLPSSLTPSGQWGVATWVGGCWAELEHEQWWEEKAWTLGTR